MNKCDFCNYSYMKDGKLICSCEFCVKTQTQIKEMMKILANIERKNK